jgi:hypothetical protein
MLEGNALSLPGLLANPFGVTGADSAAPSIAFYPEKWVRDERQLRIPKMIRMMGANPILS